MNNKKNRKELIKNIVSAGCVIVGIWIFASWLNIVTHNMTDHNFAAWNLFNLL